MTFEELQSIVESNSRAIQAMQNGRAEDRVQFNAYTDQVNRLLTRVVDLQENQQAQLNEHKQTMERVLGHIDILYGEVRTLHEEIKGLRTESLRIQRHVFGDEIDRS